MWLCGIASILEHPDIGRTRRPWLMSSAWFSLYITVARTPSNEVQSTLCLRTLPLARRLVCLQESRSPRVSPNPHHHGHDPLTRGSPESLPIASEDLAKLGIDAQHIPFIVSMTLQVEQSPDGISLTEAENLVEILDKVCPPS